jgi:methanethiol S-methyltransferase
MRRWVYFIYGAVSHTLFLGVFTYLACFVGNLAVPKSIDSAANGPIGTAVMIDVLLLVMFAAQHSIMARSAFKRYWTRIVPEPIERSTYVLAACIVTIVLMWQWRGIDLTVWDVRQPFLRGLLWGLFAVGWLFVPLTSVLINHFDLFGTRQVWLHLRRREYHALPFRVPLFYKYVRHPLYVGFMVGLWVTPTMTVGHLLFAGGLTLYIVGATLLEERDLLAHFGEQYANYRRHVPKFIPRWNTRLTAPSRPARVVEPESLQA